MSTTEKDVTQKNFEVVDHNIAAGYVTYIVDLWEGDRNDPATTVTRHIGVWRGESLEKEDGEAFDPDWLDTSSSYSKYRWRPVPKPEPVVWEQIEQVSGDKEAMKAREDYKNLTTKQEDRYYSTAHNTQVDAYEAFMTAVDRVAEDDTDEAAWKTIEQWRMKHAMKHER
jgi:hypothetical protein